MMDPSEAHLRAWVEEESHRREAEHLRARLADLEAMQVRALVFILLSTATIFAIYHLHPLWLSAGVAGLVTAWILFGGAGIVWRIAHLKRETRRLLAAEQAPSSEPG